MTDLETRLRDHFDERTRDLPDTGPGLGAITLTTHSNRSSSGRRALALAAASVIVVAAVGALVVLGNRDTDPVASPDPINVEDSTSGVSDSPPLQPVETLPNTPDVSETPVTVAAAGPVDWYRFAPDLDLAWFLDPRSTGDISMFCWRTTAVIEPQCFVDPLGATIVPLVVPVAGGQTVVLAGGDPNDPTVTITLDDGTTLEARQEFDDTIDWGAARFEVPPDRTITTVGPTAVTEPQTIENYIPPILLDFVGLELADFEEQVAGLGFVTRVVEEDGEGLDITFDVESDRINVAVDDGIVTELRPVG